VLPLMESFGYTTHIKARQHAARVSAFDERSRNYIFI
jgi:hypothetical protein